LLKINLDFLLSKTGASQNFKMELGSLHISPGIEQLKYRKSASIQLALNYVLNYESEH
jgi:hypothetical protein